MWSELCGSCRCTSTLLLLGLIPVFLFLYFRRTCKPPVSRSVSLVVVMGSGGHTSEMLSLISGFKLRQADEKYYPVTFVTANNDELSKQKVRQLSSQLNTEDFPLRSITRSRSVGQSYWTSIWTTIISFVDSLRIISEVKPHLIVCNGPAICVPICLAAKLLSKEVKIVFAESFCRTESLSLTGKILYYLRICDHFLVQWPELSHKYKRTEYIGLLV